MFKEEEEEERGRKGWGIWGWNWIKMYFGGERRWIRENILRKMYGGGGGGERSRGGHLGATAAILVAIFVTSLRLNQTQDQNQ